MTVRILRVLAPNPSVYTLEGTNTWIVGTDPQKVWVVVPDFQLSLAIGREGQNARLAARLLKRARDPNYNDSRRYLVPPSVSDSIPMSDD